MINQNTQFFIDSLIYIPMGTYNPMPLRPYQVSVTTEAINTVSDRLYQNKLGSITPSMVSGVTASILQPSTVAFDSVINSNWVSTRRFLFMMKVRYADYSGVEINSYLFGYTEYDGINTSTGSIDPKLVHYVNNIIDTNVYVWNTPLGVKRSEKIHNLYNAIYSNDDSTIYTQRPKDVYQVMTATDMFNAMDVPVASMATMSMITPFSNNVISSNVSNNISTEYVANILTAGMHATKEKEIHINSYDITSTDSGDKYFTEPSISENDFVRALSKMAGFNVVRPMFQFETLAAMDNTIYDRFNVINVTKTYASPVMSATPEVGDFWHGQDPVTVKAYSIIENAIGVAAKHGFTKLSFIASNKADVTGQVIISILNMQSFMNLDDIDNSFLLDMFKEKFNVEVFMNESGCGRIPLHIECHIDLLGSSKIYIEYAGYNGNWYTLPTFANSMFSPVLTGDQELVDYTSTQFNAMINTIIDAKQQNYF